MNPRLYALMGLILLCGCLSKPAPWRPDAGSLSDLDAGAEAMSDDAKAELAQPEASYCGNGACENGEDECTCPEDCGDPCSGKECGDDGCGGSCGECQGEQGVCVEGECVCEPDCNFGVTIFEEDFESYPEKQFPDSTWEPLHNCKSNPADNIITTEEAHSGSNSFQLYGSHSGCWSATATHLLDSLPQNLRIEAYLMASGEAGQGSCSGGDIALGLVFQEEVDIGYSLLFVGFHEDMNVYLFMYTSDATTPILQSYSPGQWYHVAIDVDTVVGTVRVGIDDSSYGPYAWNESLFPHPLSQYRGIGLASADGKGWVDDVIVWQSQGPVKCGDDGCRGSCREFGMCEGYEVWTDPTSGLTWQVQPTGGTMNWSDAKAHCAGLSLNGGGWHLPTISELRTLIRGCPATVPGGSCNVEEGGCLEWSCRDSSCGSCLAYDGPGEGGMYWPDEIEGDCCLYWSSSPVEDYDTNAWDVIFSSGYVHQSHFFLAAPVRCVR